MSAPIPLTDRQRADLHASLRLFEEHDRQRGLPYLKQGRVQRLELARGAEPDDQIAFIAAVQGSQLYEVKWTCLADGTWISDCSCPVGGDCKHAFAAAMAALGTTTAATIPDSATVFAPAPAPGPSTPSSAALVAEEHALIDRLEERHGRTLEKKEINFIRELSQLWLRQRLTCAVYEHDLVRLGLGSRREGFANSYNPVITDWWDGSHPVASPFEFWQFLALFAERTRRDLPPLLRPITDVSLVRDRVAARERQRRVEHWEQLFANDRQVAAPPPLPGLPSEVRLRLTAPRLTWEYRDTPAAPWQTAKGARARDWFSVLATNPAGAEPTTLALLQEVQLARTRQQYWSSTEPQTLKLDEPRTLDLIRWLLLHPALRHLLVDANGEAFTTERVLLSWLGRPLSDRPDDIVIDLVQPDGAPAPASLMRLPGRPELALAGRTVFELPAPLPGHEPRAVVIPREALASPAAAKRLHRAGVRMEGVDLPEVEVVVLRPRFVCSLADDGLAEPGLLDLLEVRFVAVAPLLGPITEHRQEGWSPIAATRQDPHHLREFDLTTADAALPLLEEMELRWGAYREAWIRRVTKAFPEQFADWVEHVRSLNVEVECDPELAGLALPAGRARLEVSIKADDTGSGIDWFDLEITVRAEDTTLTDEEIRLLLKAKGRFVKLAGKGWKRLQLELDPAETARLAELGLDATALEGPAEHQRFHALQLADERIAGLLPEAHAARVRERAAQLRTIAAPPVPAGLIAELRPYQCEGFHFLAHLAANGLGGVLADDMGLGKTVQLLAWLLHLAAQRGAAKPLRALVVCPKSVVPNWELETKRFAPSLTVAAFASRAVPAGVNLVVANYAQLRLAAKTLGAENWDAVILDEGQNIKNPQSQTARVARDLRSAHRIVLTGTPIENRTLDLWSLFAFAMPGLLGSQASFKRTFNDKTEPAGARARLARRVKHFMLRRAKSQVATELPPRIEEDLFVDLEGPQRRLYDAELKRTRAMLLGVKSDREFDKQRFNILQSLLRLRQICCDPRLIGYEEEKSKRVAAKKAAATHKKGDEDEAPVVAGETGSAKLDALLDTLVPLIEEGHRVLVFSQFVSLLELVAEELRSREIAYLMLTGQTENRQALVDRFQSAEGESVFLLSLKAAGSGLNLTAASYVVLFDPWWNPAVEAQAIDRTHRIGQKEQVIAYRLLARGTIEEKIRKLQQAKSDLANSIVQEENLATVMSLDDLRFVLGTDGAE
ncbi:MAG: DEAD/DEAH box helicase [Opitutaceae bacterium]|nr:DEAD/DEAH box helicase [Opitutaceae bacterium]